MVRKIRKEKDNQKLTVGLLQDIKNLSKDTTEYSTIWIKRVPEQPKPIKKVKRISKNTAYKRGRQFEYRVKKHFEKQGYYVVRKYASKGAEDLIAMKSNKVGYYNENTKKPVFAILSEVLLIQCKNLKVEKPLKKEEKDRLKILAQQCGATPLHAFNRNHKLIIEELE